MGAMASQITSLAIVYSTLYSDADQRKHGSSASLAFVRGIHWGPVNSPHKWPVTRKMFPFHDVIMRDKIITCAVGGGNCNDGSPSGGIGMTVWRSWWRHQMETFSTLLAICAGNSSVTGEFPAQRPVTRSFDVFFDLRLNKRLSKQWWGWWFETLWRPLWRHCNVFQLQMILKPSILTDDLSPYL